MGECMTLALDSLSVALKGFSKWVRLDCCRRTGEAPICATQCPDASDALPNEDYMKERRQTETSLSLVSWGLGRGLHSLHPSGGDELPCEKPGR